MTNEKIVDLYDQFCKHKDIKNPGIITTYKEEEETLKDVMSSLYSQGFRKGREYGIDEARVYTE